MTPTIEDLEVRVGLPLQDHQREAVQDAADQAAQGAQVRLCLYHRTGAGKTYTALLAVAVAGAEHVLVLAPPVTHGAWQTWAERVGLAITPISHAKFRQPGFKVHPKHALIVDEFHLLGGQGGKGWKKLDRIAAGLQAPLIIASATPNYNDAERCYCIQHVLDPASVKGGYLEFLYRECITRQNPYGKTPFVDGFHRYADAEDYLKHLPRVHYVEDEAIKQVDIADVAVSLPLLEEIELLEEYGLDRRRERVIASQMEEKHALKRHQLLDEDGLIRPEVYERIAELVGQVATPSLVFCASAEVAMALHTTCARHKVDSLLVTGNGTAHAKRKNIAYFLTGEYPLLIGTASLATGTDGVDKMCDHLLIVDDTDDDALRRQLMGRILPRGLDSDVSNKVFTGLVVS